MAFIAIENLSFSYEGEDKKALKDLTLCIDEGEFVVVCGATGSGKSTLLRLLKRELAPRGKTEGKLLYNGKPIHELSQKESACTFGFVMQRPEQQIVTDRVWHELAFGLENVGCPKDKMSRAIAETTQFFGIEDWFDKNTHELSGGQKQLLSLAAVTAMRPSVLILDEPTARLDPVAAADFLNAVGRLNREMGITVIMAEHRLDEVMPLCHKLIMLKNGKLQSIGTPQSVCAAIKKDDPMSEAMPASVRLYNCFGAGEKCPVTLSEGRRWLKSNFGGDDIAPEYNFSVGTQEALVFNRVCFRYGKNEKDILTDTDISVKEGEIFCLLGGNGSGKSTALKAAAGLVKPYSGQIKVFGKRIKDYPSNTLYKNCLAMLPQDVQTVFFKNTVGEELADVGLSPDALPFDFTPLLPRHPYDLSGGEQQLLALAKVLAAKPRLLLLDEPTNGVDAAKKKTIISVIKKLKDDGVTVVAVTHDTELAACIADRCALFFRGGIAACGEPHEFFAENSFYTTAADRLTRGIYDGCITVEEAAARMGGNT